MNCFEPAPELYSDIVRYPHIVSMILYVLTFRALYQKQNENFKSFSKLLLWHTIGSFVSQMYFSFLAIPVPYTQFPIYRFAGFLMYLDVPGVLAINIELILITMSEFLKVSIGNEPLDTKYQFVYILMPYHGTAATVSMVCFTRPVREKIIQSFRFGVKAKVEEIKKDTKTMG
ncbi:hypothetical protein L5515_007800 [Caenorhabditis briggsae]|uniref:Uncharacterized protein n=1 Tax=Caenorhabditis briggsae TaxID=6238 RepID=A0AAE9F459_CAEBR|nr:hypothetical protein L5515_007800 [Caenorhabditis briggsae]